MKLVIFDVDGTLVDSQEFILEAQRRAFAAHGMPMPAREDALSIVGLSLVQAITVLVGHEAPVESIAQAYRDAWTMMRDDPAYEDLFYPGALETVTALAERADIQLGLATGKSQKGVRHLLDRCGWHTVFATVQTADDHPSKPAPDMILQAMRDTGAAPEATFMIGDTSYDMAMAKAAGVHAVGVAWGYHKQDALRAAGAKTILPDFAALADLLA